MSNFKGKRMVSEDLIKKLKDLQPGGGSEYTPGTGIEISAQNEISIDTDTVATKSELFSGDYDDLTNKPTIPTVNNNTITITQGGATKGSFTLNQNSDATIALDAGGSTTEVAIGWMPDGDTRTNYDFTNDSLADLITLGLPIIATNDTTNYPLDSRIVLDEYYRFYGAGLIIYNATNYRVVLAGTTSSSTIRTYATRAFNASAAAVNLVGLFKFDTMSGTADSQYYIVGTGATDSVTSSTLLTEPYIPSKAQDLTRLSTNKKYWDNLDDGIKSIFTYSVQPYIMNNSSATNISSITPNTSLILPGDFANDKNAIYINSVVADGSPTLGITYGWNVFNKSFIDTNIVPDVSQKAAGTYQLTATNSNGTTTYTWGAPVTPPTLHLYIHHIILINQNNEDMATVDIITQDQAPFTMNDLITFLYNKNITSTEISPYSVRVLGTYQPSPKFDVALWTEGTQLLFGGTQTGSTAGAASIYDTVYEID